MILFVTQNNIHDVPEKKNELLVINLKDGINSLTSFIIKSIERLNDPFNERIKVGYDTEFSSLDPYHAHLRIVSIGGVLDNYPYEYIFDTQDEETKIALGLVLEKYKNNITFIGANIKVDYKVSKIHMGNELLYCEDVIIADQKLYQNMDYTFSLFDVHLRHLKKEMKYDKGIRSDFINSQKVMKFSVKHILYAAEDIAPLIEINKRQSLLINRYNMNFSLYKIEYPLINVLAEMELYGLPFNNEKWLEVLKVQKELLYETELKLDKVCRDLLKKYGNPDNIYVKHHVVWKERKKPVIAETIDLFTNAIHTTDYRKLASKNNFNYSSSKQLIEFFALIEQPLPTKDYHYTVPVTEYSNRNGKGSFIVVNDTSFTTGKDELEQYIINLPNAPTIELVKLLIKYRLYEKRISTYGQKWIDKYLNPITNKVHTVFRQCSEDKSIDSKDYGVSPVNGRLSSGNSSQGFPNMQNIPRENMYRECFTSINDDYNISTQDLTGAEVTIMADKANDSRLLELNGKNIHNHMATKGWRKIYKHRASKYYNECKNYIPNEIREVVLKFAKNEMLLDDFEDTVNSILIGKTEREVITSENYVDLIIKYKTYIVSKEVNPDKRQSAKNLTFGSVYGCKDNKAARTINVEKEEGGLYIETIKNEIPDTFNMVERNVKRALRNGYLILNERTNSRVWFPNIVRLIKENKKIEEANLRNPIRKAPLLKPTKDDEYLVDGQARNIPISGTQADMIKESMVKFYYNYQRPSKDPHLKLLLQVHDELVLQFNKSYTAMYKGEELTYDVIMSKVIVETCNKYLNNFTMSVDTQTHKTWKK